MEVDLPTVGVGVDPALDAHADAAHVRAVLDRLDGPVLLCGNSYGGVVITEASAGHRQVVRLVYLAAFMPDALDELPVFLTSSCSPEFMSGAIFGDDGLIRFDPELTKKFALQQATAEVATWATDRIRPMAMGGGGAPTVTGVGWRTIPSTYVVCGEDRSIMPDAQRRWAASAPPTGSSCPSTTARTSRIRPRSRTFSPSWPRRRCRRVAVGGHGRGTGLTCARGSRGRGQLVRSAGGRR